MFDKILVVKLVDDTKCDGCPLLCGTFNGIDFINFCRELMANISNKQRPIECRLIDVKDFLGEKTPDFGG